MPYFGEYWEAGVTDDRIEVDVPVGKRCMWCQEEIQIGDIGYLQATGDPIHRECAYRGVVGGIGHHVDHAFYCTTCEDPDAGFSYRESAMLVWYHNHTQHISKDFLKFLKRLANHG